MKKNQKLKNTIELYKKIWKSIVITVLCLSIWWCINGFIDNKWTGVKEHFLLLDDAIVQSISFLVTLSVITLIWQGFFLYYFSRITTLNGVTHRPSILGYMTFLSFTECYYPLVMIIYVAFHLGELRKTMLVLFIYALIELSYTLSENKKVWKKIPTLWQEAYSGKLQITTYLSTMDFPTKHSKFELQNTFKTKFFELDDTMQSSISSEYIKKVSDGLLCSYWIFVKEAMRYGTMNTKLLIIIDKNFAQLSDKQVQHLLQIIDEHLKRNGQVLALRQSIFSYSDNLKTIEKSQFYSMDSVLLSELRKRHIQLIFDDADDAMILRDYLSVSTTHSESYMIIRTLKEQLHTLSQHTNKPGDKYQFINYVVSGLQPNADMTDNFYTAMRMVEYIFHYRALCELSTNPQKQANLPDSLISTMGFWMTLQSSGKKKYDGKTATAYQNIYNILKGKPYTKTKVNYADICSLLTELRNRYIGHGTMAFSISAEMFSAVLELILVIVQVFEEDTRMLSTTSMLFDNIPAYSGIIENMQMQSGLLFAYKEKGDQNTEYLDYMHGAVFAKETPSYQLDYMGEC